MSDRYFWVRPRLMDFKVAFSEVSPYLSPSLLQMEEPKQIIDESLLVYQFDADAPLPKAHFVSTGIFPILICTSQTRSLFGDMLVDEIITYHGTIDDHPYEFLACMRECSCFNYEKSHYKRYELPPPDNDISNITQLYIKEGDLDYGPIFRLGSEWGTRFHLVVSEEFVRVYEEHELTGLFFYPATPTDSLT